MSPPPLSPNVTKMIKFTKLSHNFEEINIANNSLYQIFATTLYGYIMESSFGLYMDKQIQPSQPVRYDNLCGGRLHRNSEMEEVLRMKRHGYSNEDSHEIQY